MFKSICVIFSLGLGLTGAHLPSLPQIPDLEGMTLPEYTQQGELIRPKGYRTWVFVGASLGLSYNEEDRESRQGPGSFHNVYIQPEAYHHYRQMGKFPEKTMLAMESYLPGSRESINQAGYFEKEFTGLSVAVKDAEHSAEGWSYVSYGGAGGELKETSRAFPKESCYGCHHAHGADDNVFVQFYPILTAGAAATEPGSGRQE